MMTLEEAKKVAAIIGTTDHGCTYCAKDLAEKLAKDFPQFTWKINPNWTDESDMVLVEPANLLQETA